LQPGHDYPAFADQLSRPWSPAFDGPRDHMLLLGRRTRTRKSRFPARSPGGFKKATGSTCRCAADIADHLGLTKRPCPHLTQMERKGLIKLEAIADDPAERQGEPEAVNAERAAGRS